MVYLWSIITWPIYFLIYRPWKKTPGFTRKRSNRIEIQMDQIVYRAPHRHCPIRQRLQNEGLTTMDKVLKYGVSKHGKRNCIGTRKILEERKVTGPDGRTLTKLVMEPKYRWLNYDEVYDKSTYIGR